MEGVPLDPSTQIPARSLRLLVTVGAAALFAFGVFCWIAANWADFHRLTKIGVVGGLLLGSCVIAAGAPRARPPFLLLANGATGGVLALIGQIYPSGADAWQLFALWSALALPFALAARHDAVWVLWTLVAAAGIGLWRLQEHPELAFGEVLPSWGLALALAAFLCPQSPTRRLVGRANWSFRLASVSAIALFAFVGLDGAINGGARGDAALLASLLVLVFASGALILLKPLDLGLLTCAFAAIDTLLIARILIVLDKSFTIPAVMLVAIAAAAIVVGSVWVLRIIHLRTAASADEGGRSWPLAALSGLGALLAAFPLMMLYTLVFDALAKEPAFAALIGGATLAIAVFILRGGVAFGFRQMFGLIAAGVGMALVGYAALEWFDRDAGFALALLSALVAFAVPASWMRALFGFGAMGATVVGILAHLLGGPHIDGRTEAAVALASLAAAAGGGALAAGKPGASRARPFFVGWTTAGLLALMLLAGRPFLASAGAGEFGALADFFQSPWSGPAQIASILLGLAGVSVLLARRADLRTPLGFAVAACAVALTFRSPTLGAALVIFACAILADLRALASAAAIAAIWIVSAFYYALDWPLTQKAYVLMTLGAALGGVAFFTRLRDASTPTAPIGGAAVALIALGAAATAGIAGVTVREAETVLREGRIIFIALRPVDPRSLVQGDYMAIAFDTDHLPASNTGGETRAIADVDSRGVATLQRISAPGETVSPEQVIVKLRRKSGRWFVGSDAWFFEEGHGKDFVGAKFGQFRVGADGRLFLTGLADQNLRSPAMSVATFAKSKW